MELTRFLSTFLGNFKLISENLAKTKSVSWVPKVFFLFLLRIDEMHWVRKVFVMLIERLLRQFRLKGTWAWKLINWKLIRLIFSSECCSIKMQLQLSISLFKSTLLCFINSLFLGVVDMYIHLWAYAAWIPRRKYVVRLLILHPSRHCFHLVNQISYLLIKNFLKKTSFNLIRMYIEYSTQKHILIGA